MSTGLDLRFLVAKPDGRRYWQPSAAWRARGVMPRRLPDDVAASLAECDRLNRGLPGDEAPALQRPRGATLRHLVWQFEQSRFCTAKAAKTQYEYKRLGRLAVAWKGDAAAASIADSDVEALYASMAAATPSEAGHLVAYLQILFGRGPKLGRQFPTHNPAAAAGIDHSREREPMIWSDMQVLYAVNGADAARLSTLGTAVLLNSYIGQRVGDLVRLPRLPLDGMVLRIQQRKTWARVALPVSIVPEIAGRLALQRTIDACSSVNLLVDPATSRPINERWLRQAWALVRGRFSILADLQLKDLRHTAVVRLAERGATVPEICAVTGHTPASAHRILNTYLSPTETLAGNALRRRI